MPIIEQIPFIEDAPDQLLNVVLSDNPYTLRAMYNFRHGYWSLSIFEREVDVILSNIKMVKDYPLIGRFKDIRLPIGELFFLDVKRKNNRPAYESLWDGDCALVYYVPDEVAAVEEQVITASEAISGSIWDSGLSTWDSGSSTWDGA